MLTELGKIINLNRDQLDKELENIKKTQSKIDNSIFQIKKHSKENEQQTDIEECISDLEDRIREIIQSEQQTERQMENKKESNIEI